MIKWVNNYYPRNINLDTYNRRIVLIFCRIVKVKQGVKVRIEEVIDVDNGSEDRIVGVAGLFKVR